MQSIRVWALVLAVVTGASAPAMTQEVGAQDACTPSVPVAEALGVSRVVEIDTSPGPLFGAPYKEPSFLADGEVVLTFDDGPLRAYTLPVLDALAAHCVKATFFLVGRMAVADPEMVKEYARRGHTVGTHTWSHANLKALTPLKARAEIELGFSAVQQAMGKPLAPFFRFPFLRDPKSMIMHLQERQIAHLFHRCGQQGLRTRDPGTVHRKVMADLARTKKGIVLFHDIQSSTARALPGLLAELKAKGYRIVHMQPKAHGDDRCRVRQLRLSTVGQAAGDRGGPAAGQTLADLAACRRQPPADGARCGQGVGRRTAGSAGPARRRCAQARPGLGRKLFGEPTDEPLTVLVAIADMDHRRTARSAQD